MPEEDRNIYKIARRNAGITQEAAAEQLGISVESVRAYETGQRIPPNHVVSRMVICYNAQRLAVQHVNLYDELASSIIPVIQPRTMMESVVRLFNRLTRFFKNHSVERLMQIAEDNRVDEEERAEYDAIVEELKELIQCGMELRFCEHGD